MPEQKEKSLEMRVAELEDKLSKQHITEEEWKTYQKVAGALGGQASAQFSPSARSACIASSPATGFNCFFCIQNCVIAISRSIVSPIIVADCIPGAPGGTVAGGGFGTLGE